MNKTRNGKEKETIITKKLILSNYKGGKTFLNTQIFLFKRCLIQYEHHLS